MKNTREKVEKELTKDKKKKIPRVSGHPSS